MTIAIRPELDADQASIRGVHRQAFGSDVEAELVDRLREEGYTIVSLVAELDGDVVGHILFSRLPIVTPTGSIEAASLAPMGVLPAHQRRGFGSQLVAAGLDACRERGYGIAVVLGHPAFYPRFGFSAELARALESRFGSSASWMALELRLGALTGVRGRVVYPPAFDGL